MWVGLALARDSLGSVGFLLDRLWSNKPNVIFKKKKGKKKHDYLVKI
jgi:hypothetical protein